MTNQEFSIEPTDQSSANEAHIANLAGQPKSMVPTSDSIVGENPDNLKFSGLGPDSTPSLESVAQTSYVSARRLVEIRMLRYAQERDPRTGLLLKNPFLAKSQAILDTAKPGELFGILYYDFDNFKAINDKHPGRHEAGDAVVQDFTNILQADMRHDPDPYNLTSEDSRDSSLMARLGGDEFGEFVPLEPRHDPNLTPAQRLAAAMHRKEKLIKEYVDSRPDLADLKFNISVGMFLCKRGDNVVEALHKADQNMAEFKQLRKDQNGGGYRL